MNPLKHRAASVAALSALAVTVGGVAYADAATSTTHATTAAAPTSAATTTAATARAARSRARHPLLRRTLHGSLVLRGKAGKTVTVDIQRGTITDISATSLTMKSTDGVSETYVLTPATKLRSRGKAVTLATVKDGDRGLVVAIEGSSGKVARAVRGIHVPKASSGSTSTTTS
jgi:hypothetical protein